MVHAYGLSESARIRRGGNGQCIRVSAKSLNSTGIGANPSMKTARKVELKQTLDFAVRIARKAGDITQRYFSPVNQT